MNKISKPTLYIIGVAGLLAAGLLGWNLYNNAQENSSPEVVSSPVPAAKAPASATPAASPAAEASATPAATPAAKASATPAAKAPASPAAKAAPASNAQAFRDAVNKATNAAQLTQTAKTKAEWDTVGSNWRQAIDLMKAVPQANPNYQVAQKKVVEYQKYLDFSKEAGKLAK